MDMSAAESHAQVCGDLPDLLWRKAVIIALVAASRFEFFKANGGQLFQGARGVGEHFLADGIKLDTDVADPCPGRMRPAGGGADQSWKEEAACGEECRSPDEFALLHMQSF